MGVGTHPSPQGRQRGPSVAAAPGRQADLYLPGRSSLRNTACSRRAASGDLWAGNPCSGKVFARAASPWQVPLDVPQGHTGATANSDTAHLIFAL